MKSFIFVLVSLLATLLAPVVSAAPTLELPFGIKLGITKNSEIEQRGVCTKKIQLTDRHFRCEVYEMLRNSFVVASSENEVVNIVIFDADQNHSVPSSWKQLGINLKTAVVLHPGR